MSRTPGKVLGASGTSTRQRNGCTKRKKPGGHRDEQDEPGAIEDDLERHSDGYGDEADGIRRGEDGTMSGTRRNSKRVATTVDEAGQHGRCKRRTMDIPRPSTP